MTYRLNSFFTNELRQGVRRQVAGGSVYGRQRRVAQATKAARPAPIPSRDVPPARPDATRREPRPSIVWPVLRATARVIHVALDFIARFLVHLAREAYRFARAYHQPPTREARQLTKFAERVADARHEAHLARFQLQDGEEPF